MIVYQLACAHEHYFEGWFASAEACERQAMAGQLQCPTCASKAIRKLPAAPHVHTSGAAVAAAQPDDGKLHAMVRTEALAMLRKYIATHTEDVGRRFPEVARRIHYREEEARGIRGKATSAEVEALTEEGIETLTVSGDVLPGEGVH